MLSISTLLSESHTAKFAANSYLDTSVSTLDNTVNFWENLGLLHSWKLACPYFTFNDTSKAKQFFQKSLFTQMSVKAI